MSLLVEAIVEKSLSGKNSAPPAGIVSAGHLARPLTKGLSSSDERRHCLEALVGGWLNARVSVAFQEQVVSGVVYSTALKHAVVVPEDCPVNAELVSVDALDWYCRCGRSLRFLKQPEVVSQLGGGLWTIRCSMYSERSDVRTACFYGTVTFIDGAPVLGAVTIVLFRDGGVQG